VKLRSWEEFQNLSVDRWVKRYMMPLLTREADPLVEYTEPINSRIFRKADALPPGSQEEFKALRKRWLLLAATYLGLYASELPSLPLRPSYSGDRAEFAGGLADEILDATALRDLAESLVSQYRLAIAEFDKVFSRRA
jgi:hypothetical protein